LLKKIRKRRGGRKKKDQLLSLCTAQLNSTRANPTIFEFTATTPALL
jgi:hypothetical protein